MHLLANDVRGLRAGLKFLQVTDEQITGAEAAGNEDEAHVLNRTRDAEVDAIIALLEILETSGALEHLETYLASRETAAPQTPREVSHG